MAILRNFWLLLVIGSLGKVTGSSVVGENCQKPDILGFEAVLEKCQPEFDQFDQVCFLPEPNCLEKCPGLCQKNFNMVGLCEVRIRCSWNLVKLDTTELTTDQHTTEIYNTAELNTEIYTTDKLTTKIYTQFPEVSTEIGITEMIEDYSYDYYLNFGKSESTGTERSDLACIFDEQNCNPAKVESNKTGLIIGAVIGSLVFALIIILSICFYLKKKFEKKENSDVLPLSIMNENYSPKLVTVVNNENEFECRFVSP